MIRRPVLALRRGAMGRLLPGLVAVMVFLGLFAGAGALAIDQAVRGWSSGVDLGLTVTLPHREAGKAEALSAELRAIPGVASARPLAKAEVAGLLAPWLGPDAASLDLPFPGLIDLRLDPKIAVDRNALAARVALALPGARLDSHREWVDRLVRLARAAQGVTLFAVALVALAVVAVVVLAVRAGLAAEQETIELLHLIGARDGMIAAEFEGHVTRLAIIGALVGAALAGGGMLTLRVLADAGTVPLLPELGLGLGSVAVLAGFLVAAVVLARLAARGTVLLALRRMV